MKRFTQLDAHELLKRGALALARVEHAGIRIDEKYLDSAIAKTERRIKRLEAELRDTEVYRHVKRIFGFKANLDSSQQIGKVLFDVLGFEAKRFSAKTKKPSMDAEALGQIDHPFIPRWQKLQTLEKMHSTYLMNIKRETVDGFIHPMYSLNTVTSMRGSCSLINFQNQPRDGAEGKMVRRSFIPREGQMFVEDDGAAFEFKGAACVWRDPGLVEYASDPNKDIHRDMGAKIFCCPFEEVSKQMRYYGKNSFVFPKLYGSYYVKMAIHFWNHAVNEKLKTVSGESVLEVWKRNGITKRGACVGGKDNPPENGSLEKHLQGVEQWFDRKFVTLTEQKEKRWQKYLERGWFDYVTGFRISGVFSRNFFLNAGIQGPCFHILLETLIRAVDEFKRKRMKALVVGQIHDCILVDLPPNELQDVLDIIQRIMEKDIPRDWPWVIVPLAVEADIVDVGSSWWFKHPVHQVNGKWVPKAA
jgi:DNA polymerase-1